MDELQSVTTTESQEYTALAKTRPITSSWLLSTMSENILTSVTHCSSSQDLWTVLERLYASQSMARTTLLKMQLQTAKKGSSIITEFFTKMKSLSMELTAARKPVLEEDLVTCILAGLGDAYENIVVSLLARPIPPAFDEVFSILLNHEGRMEHQNNIANESVEANLTVKIGKGGNTNWNNNGANYDNNNNSARTGKSKGKIKGPKTTFEPGVFCQIYLKKGQTADECWHRKDEDFVPKPSTRRPHTFAAQRL